MRGAHRAAAGRAGRVPLRALHCVGEVVVWAGERGRLGGTARAEEGPLTLQARPTQPSPALWWRLERWVAHPGGGWGGPARHRHLITSSPTHPSKSPLGGAVQAALAG